MNILALGSTGKFAGHVVPALAARGQHVRGFVHDPAKAERARAAGAEETVVGDLRTGSLPGALEGMDGMFLILPAFAPDAAELGVAAVQAASAAGVRRVVFNSVYHPSLSLVNHTAMQPVEEALYRCDLEFTVLQPAMYLQGLAGSWRTAIRTGKFAMPYSAESRMSLVDYRDVADAVAEAFASDTLVGGTFELAAPGMNTRNQLAQAMSRRAGKEISAVTVEPGDALAGMPAGYARDGLNAMFNDYTRHGLHGGNSLVLRTVLGRSPRTLEGYLDELAVSQTSSAA